MLPSLVAIWALGGLFLSLGPSLAAETTRSANLLPGGLVIFALFGAGAAAAYALRNVGSRAALLAGCLLLIAGMALTFFAVATTTSAAFYAGTVVAGTGFGLVSLGSFRMIPARAEPGQRAGLVAAIYIAGYLAFSIPALIAGITTTRFGLHPTALVYTVAVAVLAAAAGGILLLRPDDQPGPDDQQEGSHREPPGPAASIPADTAEAAPALGSAGGAVRHGVRGPGRQRLPGDG